MFYAFNFEPSWLALKSVQPVPIVKNPGFDFAFIRVLVHVAHRDFFRHHLRVWGARSVQSQPVAILALHKPVLFCLLGLASVLLRRQNQLP